MAPARTIARSRLLTSLRRSAVVLLALAAACRPEARSPHGWQAGEQPVLRFGGVAGDSALDFLRILAGRRLPDGRILIANGGTAELRWFDQDGHHLKTVGRSPEGFSTMTAVYFEGDTALVWDAGRRTITRWSPDGALLGSRRVLLADTLRAITLRGPMGGGEVLVESNAPLIVAESTKVTRPESALFRVAGDGRADSIGTLAGDELFAMRWNRVASVVRLPFGLLTALTTLPGGYLVGDGSAPSLEEHAADGTLRRTIAWNAGRKPVTKADVDQGMRLMLGAARTGRQADDIKTLWRRMPLPDSLPWFTTVVRDPLALAWVRGAVHVSDSLATWQVLGADGKAAGTLELPARVTPLDIQADLLLLQEIDGTGIERVELRRLHRPPG